MEFYTIGSGGRLRGGPIGPPARWAATSNVEVRQTTYPVIRGRVGKDGVRARDKVTKGGDGREAWPVSRDWKMSNSI